MVWQAISFYAGEIAMHIIPFLDKGPNSNMTTGRACTYLGYRPTVVHVTKHIPKYNV